ncbi:MAG: hypothetical protein UR72_C0010G0004 [Parcubacteria group bacterium GW2011_GWC1_35_21]|nr:MAG: hypothetical protein UR72_C0010G0004 [Parcubacteria group bacterium GW2011_GWC1_35_21]
MNAITIPKKLIFNDDLIIMPRKRYQEFLSFEKQMKNRLLEEEDTNLAIQIYKKEKKRGKLKTLKSLTSLR